MAVDKKTHLENALETHRMSQINDLVGKYKAKREEVKNALVEKYVDKAYEIFNSGSFKKHTAINIKFDLDLVIPFKRNSFDTLEKMFDDVYDFLYEKYKDEATVKKQKVSIGITFDADDDGDVVCIDVTPGRELNQDKYSEDKYLNLFVNSTYGMIAEKSYLQTNIHSQIDHIKSKGDERKIIRLLKIWKFTNGEKYKSFLFELITIKAFDKVDVSGNLWDMLKTVMEYIRDNVTKDNFKLIDPGNSNNDVINTLESHDRTNLSNRMDTIIKRIEDNSENIKSYFPVNEKFEKKETSKSSYGIKGTYVTPSIPSNTQRFG
jgi:hypothetical protein